MSDWTTGTGDSLESSRRTADAGISEVEPGFQNNVFLGQNPDRGQDWSRIAGDWSRTGAMRDYANGTGRRLTGRGMRMDALGRCHP